MDKLPQHAVQATLQPEWSSVISTALLTTATITGHQPLLTAQSLSVFNHSGTYPDTPSFRDNIHS